MRVKAPKIGTGWFGASSEDSSLLFTKMAGRRHPSAGMERRRHPSAGMAGKRHPSALEWREGGSLVVQIPSKSTDVETTNTWHERNSPFRTKNHRSVEEVTRKGFPYKLIIRRSLTPGAD